MSKLDIDKMTDEDLIGDIVKCGDCHGYGQCPTMHMKWTVIFFELQRRGLTSDQMKALVDKAFDKIEADLVKPDKKPEKRFKIVVQDR